ncbi:MAG: ArnT family glycosyltransferase [Bryobacteraceae bacterium]
MRKTTLFILLAVALAASRLCHIGILWEGDAYPLAAAGQWLDGRVPYRELWFDKPPLLAVAYLMFGAQAGWPLRLFGAAYGLVCCWLAYRLARELWSEREGFAAAVLLGFFFVFDLPSSAIPVASDQLMLAPHLAAVWLAIRKKSFASGLAAGVAFWINPKGALVAAICLLWNPAGAAPLAAGFCTVGAAMALGLAGMGALTAWWDEVWRWGRLYAAAPLPGNPLVNGLVRTLDWAGFHAGAVLAAGVGMLEAGGSSKVPLPNGRGSVRSVSGAIHWLGWVLIALAGVCAGLRFFPRYYFLLLAPVALMAARGWVLCGPKLRIAVLLLLAIPMVRFAPSYASALGDSGWRDSAMDRDSRAAARLVRQRARPGDSLFVWGYRPELYPYTGLRAATMYLDSQPLSGVPADRHLTGSTPLETAQAALRRAALPHSEPTFLVDGLGPYNPRLAIGRYADLAGWLAHYREVARTTGTVIWQRMPD